MSHKVGILLLLVFGLLLGAGCARIEERKQADQLTNTIRAYESTVRWGNLNQIYGFRNPESQSEPPSGLDQIRVVSYTTVVPAVLLDEDTARQTAEISYYWQAEQAVRKITDNQTWGYDQEDKLWYLTSEVPEFP